MVKGKCEMCERIVDKEELVEFFAPLSTAGNRPKLCGTCNKNLAALVSKPTQKKVPEAHRPIKAEEAE